MSRVRAGWLIIAVSLVLILPRNAVAQYMPASLFIIPDARNYGMAGAAVADATDPTTVWHNPANAGLLSGINLLPFSGELGSRGDFYGARFNGGYPVYHDSSITLSLGGELRYSHRTWIEAPAAPPVRLQIRDELTRAAVALAGILR